MRCRGGARGRGRRRQVGPVGKRERREGKLWRLAAKLLGRGEKNKGPAWPRGIDRPAGWRRKNKRGEEAGHCGKSGPSRVGPLGQKERMGRRGFLGFLFLF
jgi:hypothetical protein